MIFYFCDMRLRLKTRAKIFFKSLSNAINAMGAGKRAAKAINEYLKQ